MVGSKLRIRKSEIPIILWCIGIFAFPYILRDSLIGKFALFNILVYTGLLYGYRRKFLYSGSTNRRKHHGSLPFFYYIVSVGLLFLVRGSGWSVVRKFILLFIYIFPAEFLFMRIGNENLINRYCYVWTKWLRVVCSIMCASKGLDMILGNTIQKMLAFFYDNTLMLNFIGSGRFVSFYGHPLDTAGFFLCLLVWTTILNDVRLEGTKQYIYDVILSLIGIAITGSKSAIILAVWLLLLCNFNFRKSNNMIAVVMLLIGLYFFGVFDLVFGRIQEGLAAGDLSTSRNTALARLMGNGTISFSWLKGNVFDYNGVEMTAALEYPLLRWAFTSGILFSVVMCTVYFIFPAIKVVRCSNRSGLIATLAFMAYVNGNNGITGFNDNLLFYAINIGLIMHLLQMRSKKRVLWKEK